MTNNVQPNGALVRRRIRLRSGAIAWRHVRPDNPNIVEDQQEPEQQAQRRARAVLQPKAEPVVAAPPVEGYDYFEGAYYGCCGGTLMMGLPKDRPAATTTELSEDEKARITKAWKTGYGGKREYDNYKRYLDSAVRIDAKFKAGDYGKRKCVRPTDDTEAFWVSYYFTQMAEMIVTYGRYVERYSLENWFKHRGQPTNSDSYKLQPTKSLDTVRGAGVTVCNVPFKGAVQVCDGLFARADVEAPGKPANASFGYKDTLTDLPEASAEAVYPSKTASTNVFAFKDYALEGGIACIYGMSSMTPAQSTWTFLKANKDQLKAGVVVTMIFNDRQLTLDKAKEMAEAGFGCGITTGNNNHPGNSTLYLYYRKLTEADMAWLNSKQ